MGQTEAWFTGEEVCDVNFCAVGYGPGTGKVGRAGAGRRKGPHLWDLSPLSPLGPLEYPGSPFSPKGPVPIT